MGGNEEAVLRGERITSKGLWSCGTQKSSQIGEAPPGTLETWHQTETLQRFSGLHPRGAPAPTPRVASARLRPLVRELAPLTWCGPNDSLLLHESTDLLNHTPFLQSHLPRRLRSPACEWSTGSYKEQRFYRQVYEAGGAAPSKIHHVKTSADTGNMFSFGAACLERLDNFKLGVMGAFLDVEEGDKGEGSPPSHLPFPSSMYHTTHPKTRRSPAPLLDSADGVLHERKILIKI